MLVLGGGRSFLLGLTGGVDQNGFGASGGFGGGGAGGQSFNPATGAFTGSGGGGGSFDSGLNQLLIAGVNSGNGSVVITALPPPVTTVPEPATFALFSVSLAGLLGFPCHIWQPKLRFTLWLAPKD